MESSEVGGELIKEMGNDGDLWRERGVAAVFFIKERVMIMQQC